jgi:hypothetical protein
MSGVEAAGFVLAVIPLVISFLEHYADGVRTIDRWRKYDRELKSLSRRLRSQEQLFRNSCELLLQRIVDSDELLQALISNPLGEQWEKENLNLILQEKLPSSCAGCMEVVEDIKDTLNEFKERLGLDEHNKVRYQPHATLSMINIGPGPTE